MNASIPVLEEARRLAEEEAQLRGEHEQQLRLAINVLREQEQEQAKRVEDIQNSLTAQVQACYQIDADVKEQSEKEQQIRAQLDELRQTKGEHVKRVEEVELNLRALEETRHRTQTETRRRSEKEVQLAAEIEALRVAEAEQLKRIEDAESRLRAQDEARQAARARVKELAEKEQQLDQEISSLREDEGTHLARVRGIEAECEKARESATTQTRALTQREHDLNDELASLREDEGTHLARVREIEAACEMARESVIAQANALTEKEQELNDELASLQRDEEGQQARVQELEAACEKARESVTAQANALTEKERELNDELALLQRDEEGQQARLQELEARVREQQEALRHAADEEQQQLSELEEARSRAEAEASERVNRRHSLAQEIEALESAPATSLLKLETVDEPVESKELEAFVGEPVKQVKEIAPLDAQWLEIDLQHSGNGAKTATDSLTDAKDIHPETPVHSSSFASQLEPLENRSSVSSTIMERLQSDASTQRASALADLTEIGGEEAFHLITKSFDDPSVEVRNAAARALYDFHPDRAASFTRALREASPERRRKIGSAIAGSGLAANAINSLSGEGRDRTYDAYSILFLMANAGRYSPCCRQSASTRREVRLTSIKLIALSNQQRSWPLSYLAARVVLPAEFIPR